MRVTSDIEANPRMRWMRSRHYATPAEGKCRDLRVTMAGKVGVSEKVPLVRRLSSHLGGRRPNESDSGKTSGFSTRTTCVKKRFSISDEPGGLRHHSV